MRRYVKTKHVLVYVGLVGLLGCAAEQSRPAKPAPDQSAPAAPAAAEPEGEDVEKEQEALIVRASHAYEAKDWKVCADSFAKASRLSPGGASKAASYNAACCHALAGDADQAFAELGRAASAGYRDFGHMEKDPDLASLHRDPRWQTVVGEIRAAWEAYRKTINAELLDLHDADQADRMVDNPEDIDWSKVSVRDREHRARVAEIMAAGEAKVSDDYYHAAMVYQHGDKPEHYKQAHEWAKRAAELEPNHGAAKWLAAAAEDRWLMNQGKPQKYGTQFRKTNDRWELYEVDPTVTDEERARLERAAPRRGQKTGQTHEPVAGVAKPSTSE